LLIEQNLIEDNDDIAIFYRDQLQRHHPGQPDPPKQPGTVGESSPIAGRLSGAAIYLSESGGEPASRPGPT
jgi:hypothetical protein